MNVKCGSILINQFYSENHLGRKSDRTRSATVHWQVTFTIGLYQVYICDKSLIDKGGIFSSVVLKNQDKQAIDEDISLYKAVNGKVFFNELKVSMAYTHLVILCK